MRLIVVAFLCVMSANASANPLVDEARRWIGSTASQLGVRHNLWCAAALNKWLESIGLPGTGSDKASSFAKYGHKLRSPQVGSIAVMSRGKDGGHVGVVSAVEGSKITVISGNHLRKVQEAVYPKSRIYAFVHP